MRETDPRARLVALLGVAETKLRSPAFGDAFARLSLADFRQLVSDSRAALAEGRLSRASAADLWRAFAPTGDWDDVVGDTELGDEVFELIDSLYGPPAAERILLQRAAA